MAMLQSIFKHNEEATDKESPSNVSAPEPKTKWNDAELIPPEALVMIGNGFDLECGLPTSYMDYLNFLSAVDHISTGKSCESLPLNPSVKKNLFDKTADITQWQPLTENYWYQHFKKAHIKLGWVDFENEIAKVIRTIENSIDLNLFRPATMDDCVSGMIKSDLTNTMGDLLKSFGIKSKQRIKGGGKYVEYNLLYRDLRDYLLNDLNALVRGLEAYLREFVEPLPINITKNIIDLVKSISQSDRRYVVSFNYTTTFERLLNTVGVDAKFCYVHGKIGDGKSKNKMVLGIGEYLIPNGVKNLIGFAPFRKYNQRIYKETNSDYMDWLHHIRTTNYNRMLYIFGHSLGITDKDIIEPFVRDEKVKTKVYYHDEDSFSDKVGNLTAMIGMDEMIHRTGGSYRSMEFVKQTH